MLSSDMTICAQGSLANIFVTGAIFQKGHAKMQGGGDGRAMGRSEDLSGGGAGGKPVAIMKNSKCVGYLVPEDAALQSEPRYATMDEVMAAVDATREQAQPVLEYLKDK